MPELEQFAQDLHEEVLVKCADPASPQMREDAFTECVLERLAEHNEADNAEILPSLRWDSRGRSPAAKINAWALSGDGATLDLFVTFYHGTSAVAPVSKPDVARYFGLARGFLRRAMEGFHVQLEEAHEVFEAARRIHESRDSLTTVRLFFVTDGVVGTRAADVDEEQLPGLELRYVLWDLEKLSRLRVGQRETIELDFAANYGGAISCIATRDATNEYQTFLAFLPAPLLARIYGEHGQRLLERNVRAFLQAKNKVNKGLQQTLREEPHRFLAYNNGLCCTAAEVDVELGRDGHAVLKRVKDFQIVNGGQTTASIFHAWKKEKTDIAGVVVQVKLTVLTEPAKVTEIVPLISKYANMQNRINAADFSANGKFHQDLEKLSRTLWALPQSGLERGTHWYYERARGSYLDDKARQGPPGQQKEWVRQNPPQQKFTKTDLAKYEHAWLGLPHLVCRGAEKNFEAFASRLEDDGQPSVDHGFFEHVVARAVLWRSSERLFDTLELEGYRANSVAYAVAWVAEASGRRLDLDRIWKEQRVPDDVSAALLVACRAAHVFLTGRPGNIGEASKKPETWADFRSMKLDVGDTLNKGLRQSAAIPYPAKKLNPETEAAKEGVTQATADYWFALSKWAKEHGFLEGWERSLSYSLGRLVAKGSIPSDKQAIQGARIMTRARELGFSPDLKT
ncbi:MAG TPA: AIPR family protein [Tepidisphaeraceae bacterium]|nr:AIPR family protein [Tepidisphaeraceae bacterium]